jgi:dsDNA-specific endonuclease/ATPase MutS2
MPFIIEEKNLRFSFEFDAIKFDDTLYYRDYFNKIKNGTKAIDILAVNSNIGYLIEIKDYTHPATKNKKLIDLIEEILTKIISTLAAILPMKNNLNTSIEEKHIATLFSKTNEIKIFLHIEFPLAESKLEQASWSCQKIQMRLKKRLQSIDADPQVVTKKYPDHFPWKVTEIELSEDSKPITS